MHLTSLDHLVLTVSSIETTCDWYERVLGMRTVTFAGGRKALRFGNQKINLHERGREFEPRADVATVGSGDLCFLTDKPMDAVVDHLRACNVEILEGPDPRSGAVCPILSIYVRDPDGNLIEVSNVLEQQRTRALTKNPFSLDISIRHAGPDDAAAITALCMRSKASNGYDAEFMRRCVDALTITADELTRDLWQVVDVPERTQPVGCACLRLDRATSTASLESFFIDPEFQRVGIGRSLWQEIKTRAQRAQISTVSLEADPHAVSFYAALGFVVDGEARSAVVPGRMLPVMRRAIGPINPCSQVRHCDVRLLKAIKPRR